MLGFIKDKAQKAKALVGEAVEASATAIVNSESPAVKSGGGVASRGVGSTNTNSKSKTPRSLLKSKSVSSPEGDAMSIPREDLMHLSMKLTKRLKVLESKHSVLLQERNSLRQRCSEFAELASDIIFREESAATASREVIDHECKDSEVHASSLKNDSSSSEHEHDSSLCMPRRRDFSNLPVLQVRALWKSVRSDAAKLRYELKNGATSDPSSDAFSAERLPSTLPPPNSNTPASEKLRDTVASLGQELEDALAKINELERQRKSDASDKKLALERAKAKHEEAVLFLKLKLDGAKRQAEKDAAVHARLLKEHVEETSTSSKQYKAKCEAYETERAALIKQCETLKQEASRLRSKAEEHDAAAAESAASSALINELKKAEQDASKRAEETSNALADMTREVERLRHDRATASTAADTWEGEKALMQASLDAAAAQRGNAFAALETTRRELADVESQLSHAKQSAASYKSDVVQIKANAEALQTDLKEERTIRAVLEEKLTHAEARVRESIMKEAANQLNEEKERMRRVEEERIAAMQKQMEKDIERRHRDFQRRSSKARGLVEQKEKEIAMLKERCETLTEEVESGRPQERQILEFARGQARRDAETGKLKKQVEKLQSQLQEAFKDVESHRNAENALRKVVASLQRISVVEGVNMTYLRNVVLKYLCFRPESMERLRLVPVLASMLNFSKKELSRMEGASASMVKQWWKTAGELRQEALRQDRKRQKQSLSTSNGSSVEVSAVGMGFLRSPANRGSSENMARARRERKKMKEQVKMKEDLALELPESGLNLQPEEQDPRSLLQPMDS